jgi:hypothetical protein
MVRGLQLFKEHFAAHLNQYVLIGGTACTIVMEEVGLEFRATKDLDIVLYIEAMDKTFIAAFWDFIKKGGYQNRQRSTGKEIFYRFDSPRFANYPVILELFSRITGIEKMDKEGHLQRIKMNEAATSLSAILLNDDYYQFIHAGKSEMQGLSVVRASHLIPLKARAWIDLRDKQKGGASIDNRDIRKHKNDAMRLFQLLSPDMRIVLPDLVKTDMRQFIELLKLENPIDIKQLGLRHSNFDMVLNNLQAIYTLN